MDYNLIASEIEKLDYAKLSDEEIAAVLEAKTVPVADPIVPIAAIMNYLRSNGLWLPIKAAIGSCVGAEAVVDLNDDIRVQTVDLSLPIVGKMLADLVVHKLLTQEQSDAIMAMGTKHLPFARQLDENISADVVARARIGDVEGVEGVG